MSEGTNVTRLPVDSIVSWLAWGHGQYPIVGILILMMGLDVAVGLCAAVITRSVSATVSQNGMTRKVIMLLLVGVGAVLEPYAGELPLSKLIAMAFIATEGISIVKNSARAGVPVPQQLIDVLTKLESTDKPAVTDATANQTVTINRAGSVDIHTTESPPVAAAVPETTPAVVVVVTEQPKTD